jgi:hypothetical protein
MSHLRCGLCAWKIVSNSLTDDQMWGKWRLHWHQKHATNALHTKTKRVKT